MTFLAIADNEWSARLVAQLAETETGIGAALPTGDVTRKALETVRLAEPDQEGPACDALLAIAPAIPPDWTAGKYPSAPRLLALARCSDGRAVADPVHWCIRHGLDAIEVRLLLADAAFATLRSIAVAQDVALRGLDYSTATGAVAKALAGQLRQAYETDFLATGRPVPLPDVFPIGRTELRIEWSAAAGQVAALIRSAADRIEAAWTYLDGFPVAIRRAHTAPVGNTRLAPGTIVSRGPDDIVVQTGHGLVTIAAISDAVGAMPHMVLRPGIRLGVDAAEEIRALRGRVKDLERTVHWLFDQSKSWTAGSN